MFIINRSILSFNFFFLLQWNDYLDSFYKGLLIKVMIRCTYHGITDDRCLMLKAQGTHQCKFHNRIYQKFFVNAVKALLNEHLENSKKH